LTTLAQALQANRPTSVPPSVVLGTTTSTTGQIALDTGGTINCVTIGSPPATGKRVLVLVTSIGNFVLGPMS